MDNVPSLRSPRKERAKMAGKESKEKATPMPIRKEAPRARARAKEKEKAKEVAKERDPERVRLGPTFTLLMQSRARPTKNGRRKTGATNKKMTLFRRARAGAHPTILRWM